MKTKPTAQKSNLYRPTAKQMAAFLTSRQKRVIKGWEYYCMTAIIEEEFLLDVIDKLMFLYLYNLNHGYKPKELQSTLFYLTDLYLIRDRMDSLQHSPAKARMAKGWKKSLADHIIGKAIDPKKRP